MKKTLASLIFGSLIVLSSSLSSQNQAAKWYFGTNAGLDFMTNPPTVITTAAMSAWEGSASIADAAGNLLFYTDGITVYNANNVVMANGSGLNGNSSSTQSGVIIQKPGSNSIYYIFSLAGSVGPGPLEYSEVDMTLSAGLGSVTVLNTPLWATSSEKLTAVRHCNGVDAWAISHDMNTNNFRAYLITSAGVNPVPVISSLGAVYTDGRGYLKASPNGTKLGLGDYSTNNFAIYDFNASTGVVTNEVILGNHSSPYGFEFSPDGTKAYGACENGDPWFYQWDICAGSPQAIAASQYTTATTGVMNFAIQTAPNGKIYVSPISNSSLSVINNPNVYGAGMNFVSFAQPIAPGTAALGLPNFITSLFNVQSPQFSFTTSATNVTLGCQSAMFMAPTVAGYTSCVGGSTLTGIKWNFGDPASGPSNTSTAANPTHNYSSQGTFTPQLIFYYNNFCGNVTDTVRQTITFNQPCVSFTAQNVSCAAPGSATVLATAGNGPFSYTWLPTGQTTSVVSGLSPGTYTIQVLNLSNNISYNANITLTSSTVFSGTLSNSSSVTCFGANTGTASITMSGGSGSQYYAWTNGVLPTQTTALATGLLAGVHTVTVIDAITSCKEVQTYTILSPGPLVLNTTISSPTACAGTNITFTATSAGGTPAYSYTWTGGPVGQTHTVSETVSGIHTYIANSSDANNCLAVNVVTVTFIDNPIVTVRDVSVCPSHLGVLTASGAVTYTWNGSGPVSPTFAASPAATTVYTVVGQVGDCISVPAFGKIVTLTPPTLTATTSGPVCKNQPLTLTGFGGASNYQWKCPFGLNLAGQTVTFAANNTAYTGIYTLTAFGSNGCLGLTTTATVVYDLPMVGITRVRNEGCVPFCTTVMADPTTNVAVNNWTINSVLFPTSSFSYCFNAPGNYKLYADITHLVTQCTNTISYEINAYPQPKANFEFFPEKPIENLDEVTFNSTPTGNQIQEWDWHFINNNGYRTNGAKAAYVFESNGTFPVAHIVKDIHGCMDTVVKAITVEPDFHIYVPTAFTPNADDKNETFQAKGSGIVNFNMKVYSRWGELIFESNDFYKGWDGTFKGVLCPNGEYAWKIAVTGAQKQTKSLAGHVILYR